MNRAPILRAALGLSALVAMTPPLAAQPRTSAAPLDSHPRWHQAPLLEGFRAALRVEENGRARTDDRDPDRPARVVAADPFRGGPPAWSGPGSGPDIVVPPSGPDGGEPRQLTAVPEPATMLLLASALAALGAAGIVRRGRTPL